MKKKISCLLKTVLLFAVLVFSSCETEKITNEFESNSKIRKSFINLKKLEEFPNALKRFNYIKSKTELALLEKKKNVDKLTYNSDYNFYIDTEKILVSQMDGYISFTFPIYRDESGSKLENLILSFKDNLDYKEYIAKYQLTDGEKEMLKNGLAVPNIDTKTDLETIDGVKLINSGNVDRQVYVDANGNCYVPDHIYYDDSGDVITTFVQIECPDGGGGGDTGDGENSGGGNSGGDGGNSGAEGGYSGNGGASEGTGTAGGGGVLGGSGSYYGGGVNELPLNNPHWVGVITGPVITSVTDDNEIQQIKFIKNLSPNEENWLNSSENSNVKNEIFHYLFHNHYSESSMQYVIQMIDLSINTNSTFEFSPNLNSTNSQSFQNIDEIKYYLQDISSNVSNNIQFQNISTQDKTAKFTVTYNNYFNFNIELQQKINPWSLTSISSGISGFTFGFSYDQFTLPTGGIKVNNGEIRIIKFSGDLHFNVFFQGIGTLHTFHLNISCYVNSTTGQPMYCVINGLP